MSPWYRAPSAPAANRPAHGTPQQAPGSGTAAHASNRHPSSPGSMRTPHSQHTNPRARIQQAPAYERPPRAAANGSPGIPFSGEVGAKCEQPASHSPENGTGFSANPIGQQFLFPLPAISEPHDTRLPTNPPSPIPTSPQNGIPGQRLFPSSHHFGTFRAPDTPAANRPASGTRQRNGRACPRRPSSARATGSRCATFRPDVASFRGYANGMPPRVQVSRIARKTQFA